MGQYTQRVMDSYFPTSGPVNYLSENPPGQSLQAQINAAHSQGGDVLRLGPYEYTVNKSMTLKEGVTIIGVPGKTKLIKRADKQKAAAGSYAAGELGPVITLEAGARLVDCYVDLVLPTGYSFRRDSDTLVTPSDATGTATSRADDNAVVVFSGARARMEGCYIPEGDRRAVVIKADNGILLGNEIEHDQTKLNASIYINDAVNDTLVSGNWTNSASTAGAISYLGSTTQWISGNLANILVR